MIVRRIRLLLLVGFLPIFFLSCQQTDTRNRDGRVLRIGVIASVTGAAAPEGESWLRGVHLGVETLRGEGEEVELRVEDDKTLPSEAVRAFEFLSSVHTVDVVIGGTWDFLLHAIEPRAALRKIPLITPTNPVELLSKDGETLTTAFSLAAEQKAFEQFLRVKGFRRIALIYSAIPWGEAHADYVRRSAEAHGASIVYEERFPMESYAEVVATAVHRLANHNPDLVYVVFDGNGLAQFVEGLARLKVAVAVINPQHLDRAADLLGWSNPALANVFGIFPKDDHPEFTKKYQARFGSPPRVYAVEGYEATITAARVLRAGAPLNRARLVKSEEKQELNELKRLPPGIRWPTFDGGLSSREGVVKFIREGSLAPLVAESP